MKFPRLRVHLLTAIILQIVLSVLIWANVRERPSTPFIPFTVSFENSAYGVVQPGKHTISGCVERGWPCNAYSTAGFTIHDPQGNSIDSVIWNFNGVVANSLVNLLFLTITWLACERLIYRKRAEAAA